jgi:lauroyl/myristoyl acyltransferase
MMPQAATATAPVERARVSPESTVDLFPVAIRRTHFKFQVVGLSSKRSVFLTADETVALRFLLNDRVLSKATARLHAFNARTNISYADLVSRLIDARLVRRIDGCEIEKPYAGWRQLAASRLAHLVRAVPSEAGRLLETAGSRLLPFAWILALNRAVIALSLRRRRGPIVDRLKENMARILVDAPVEQLNEHADRFVGGFVHTLAELALLQVAPDDRVCRWVLRSMKRYDIAPLRAALAQGNGAIVFHYHMGPIQYVPLLLSALGFKVTLLGMSMARPRRTRMYFTVVDDLRPAGVMKLLRALQRGEVVVISPDVDIRSLEDPRKPKNQRDELFAGAWKKGSQLPLTFLGHQILTYAGLVWLQEQSGSPLVVSSVVRDRDGDVSLECAPFEPADRSALTRAEWTQRTMELVYRRYEQDLYSHPEQWAHWISFFPRYATPPTH